MVKLNQGLTLGVLLVVIVVMILKPNLLGFLYNNVLGKLIFVAAIVFLSLKHTAAGLLAVVFVAIIASMSGYYGFEGFDPIMEGGDATPTTGDEEEDNEKKKAKKAKKTEGYEDQKKKEGLKTCEGDDCDKEEEQS